ncbi:hypothetical protein LJ656_10960 [Paraburkholderia sp. MMS20-SJTR3]|uniref:Uncharacterized protein n=1 Tax=Paraburkholderia sejongensis TaxID=2886946 RepID=A0ABS8JT71_9BURK|nr:hypothetical protein [Paraburkholderia sp. MMS20-SJTR3]MCC8393110.1 hypothetical protein [Paraburkholderia sp. MMS20-SJTR3]
MARTVAVLLNAKAFFELKAVPLFRRIALLGKRRGKRLYHPGTTVRKKIRCFPRRKTMHCAAIAGTNYRNAVNSPVLIFKVIRATTDKGCQANWMRGVLKQKSRSLQTGFSTGVANGECG